MRTVTVTHNPGLTPRAAMTILRVLLEDTYTTKEATGKIDFQVAVQKDLLVGVLVGLRQQEGRTSFAISGSWPSRAGLIIGLGPLSWPWLKPAWNELENDIACFIQNTSLLRADEPLGRALHRHVAPKPQSREEWQRLLRELTPHDPGNRWFLRPEIPKEKLDNAVNTYGASLKRNDVLALGDSTFFGSAKSGCLLTTEGICCRVAVGGKVVRWPEIASVRIAGSEGIQIRLRDKRRVRLSCGQFLLVRDKLHRLLSVVSTSNRARSASARDNE